MEKNEVAIVTVNYNKSLDTIKLLASIKKSIYPFDLISIIIIDNCSDDLPNFASIIKKVGKDFKSCVYLKNEENVGLSFALNQAYKLINKSVKYVWRLDNDVLVSKFCLSRMVSFLNKNSNIGCLGSRANQYNYPNKFLSGYWKFNWLFGLGIMKNSNVPKSCDFVSGYSLLIRKETLDKVGYLSDEIFEVYFEDVDFCKQIANKGKKVVYFPASVVLHRKVKSKETNKFIIFYLTRNRILLMRKNTSYFIISIFFIYLLLISFPLSIVKIFYNSKDFKQIKELSGTYIKASLDGFTKPLK